MISHIKLIAAVLLLAVLEGCATTSGAPPTNSNEALAQLAVSGAISVAVDRIVTKDHATPADIEARAGKILLVATSLKALDSGALSTLPKINAALDPLLAKLNLTTQERIQANLLVSALVSVGLERVDAAKYLAQVSFVLDEVIRDSSAYLPTASPVGWLKNGLDHFAALVAGDRRKLFPECS